MSDLFRPVEADGNWHLNALVGGRGETDAILAYGFTQLAMAGINEIVSNGPHDALFVPIVFNYRHGFELVLKDAIRQAARLVRRDQEECGQPVDPNLLPSAIDRELTRPDAHALGRLLDMLTALFTQGGLEALPAETVDTIRQLHELDETGQAFRYTMVKDKKTKGIQSSCSTGLH
jgi:hypothetical protein